MQKIITLASFISIEKVDSFLGYLESRFSIKKEKVFCYKNIDDDSKVIITFKLVIPEGEYINLKEVLPSAIPIHKRGDALYTINALNMLIEETNKESLGNIDYKSIKVDWSVYQGKLILTNSKGLTIFNIERVF